MTNPVVAEIFDRLTDKEIRKLCVKSGITYQQAMNWIESNHSPKIDTISRVALCAGFKIVLLPIAAAFPTKEKFNMSYSLKINNERQEVWNKNKIIAYVDNEILYAIDRKNYAKKVATINHSREIISKLMEWRKEHGYE